MREALSTRWNCPWCDLAVIGKSDDTIDSVARAHLMKNLKRRKAMGKHQPWKAGKTHVDRLKIPMMFGEQ